MLRGCGERRRLAGEAARGKRSGSFRRPQPRGRTRQLSGAARGWRLTSHAGGSGRGRERPPCEDGALLFKETPDQAKGPFALTFLQGLGVGVGAVTGRVASSRGRAEAVVWTLPGVSASYFLTAWLGAVSQLCPLDSTSIPSCRRAPLWGYCKDWRECVLETGRVVSGSS